MSCAQLITQIILLVSPPILYLALTTAIHITIEDTKQIHTKDDSLMIIAQQAIDVAIVITCAQIIFIAIQTYNTQYSESHNDQKDTFGTYMQTGGIIIKVDDQREREIARDTNVI